MRLQQYLTEKYYNTIKQGFPAGDFDVFESPSSKELRELETVSADTWNRVGYRYIIDFKEKKFYAFSLSMVHETFFKKDPKYPRYDAYWNKGEMLDHLYTGHVEYGEDKSDALVHFAGAQRYGVGDGYTIRKALEKLAAQDWSWTNKYINANKVQKLVLKASNTR